MIIGVPTEIKNNEYRVALTPAGVHELVLKRLRICQLSRQIKRKNQLIHAAVILYEMCGTTGPALALEQGEDPPDFAFHPSQVAKPQG